MILATIQIGNQMVTLDDEGVWVSDNESLLDILNGSFPLVEESPSDPDIVAMLADRVATELGGQVIDIKPPTRVPGEVY